MRSCVSFPRADRPLGRATKSEVDAAHMARAAFEGLSAARSLEVAYTILVDKLSAEDLETLANKLGRAGHEKGRYK